MLHEGASVRNCVWRSHPRNGLIKKTIGTRRREEPSRLGTCSPRKARLRENEPTRSIVRRIVKNAEPENARIERNTQNEFSTSFFEPSSTSPSTSTTSFLFDRCGPARFARDRVKRTDDLLSITITIP